MTWLDGFYIFVIIATIAGVGFGRIPVFRMNRATISLVGATLLIAAGSIPLEDAYKAIDFNTIVLLLSMMVINANLRISGFFKIITREILKFSRTQLRLLILIIFSSGFLSAFFLNDTVVLVFTPLIIEITIYLRRNPVPYLIALALSANIGSAATIVGNPQNMIIGTQSLISFSEFSLYLFPPAISGLFIVYFILKYKYRDEFKNEILLAIPEFEIHIYKPLLLKGIIALLVMVVAFFSGVPVTQASLCAAAFLLFTRRIKPERVFKELDWSLLVFFSSLFIVTSQLTNLMFGSEWISGGILTTQFSIIDLSVLSVVLSNLISNVPAVMVLSPMVGIFDDPKQFWLILALTSTFAGNLTLIGSVANLIVAESARKQGVNIKFSQYLRIGFPLTLVTTLIGVVWLFIVL